MDQNPSPPLECESIEVAGDICLDVVAVPIAPPASLGQGYDNWRQTGETRTHFLPGGALLLREWVQEAATEYCVLGPRPCLPAALACGNSDIQPLTIEEFLKIAERLTRDEIVHSLLELDCFPATSVAKDREQIRVLATHGFSGPKSGDPSLKILPPDSGKTPKIIVLDDTGNRFRRTVEHWPASIVDNPAESDSLVIYKLHRPLPATATSTAKQTGGTDGTPPETDGKLWSHITQRFPKQRIVIVSIDDLRDRDVPISRGLSWERTALDLVWQLLNSATFAELRACPHLIVRFGLNGAVYWHCRQAGEPKDPQHQAWLIYNPAAIEGSGEHEYEGRMVGFGSAFTAAFTASIAKSMGDNLVPQHSVSGEWTLAPCIETGIRDGLLASVRLLKFGFGCVSKDKPAYPGKELFAASKGEPDFACQPIPIIPGAAVPDRGYWRLLDSIFESRTKQLHKAVALTATGAKPGNSSEEESAKLLKHAPIAVFAKALRTYDRREIENYRGLYSLMLDYISQISPPRPLSIAVFGPPGAGKSFGVKMVAKALSQLGGPRPIETLTFNLSQYQTPEQLADAFHLVRDLVLKGKIPLIFFDEFDSAMAGERLGWLRYFLAPMQDAEFLDNGVPHPIGQAIFVFAGGTCSTYSEFAAPFLTQPSDEETKKVKNAFKAAKGPDFLSRLRGTLDIPGLDLNAPFDPFGPVEAIPCEAAILLRRAGILAHQLGEKAPHMRNTAKALQISPVVLRALLHLPKFVHGNRSFEALLDMSNLTGSTSYAPSLLPSPSHSELHADSVQLSQLLRTEYPFPDKDREIIARAIHDSYVSGHPPDPNNPSLAAWENLREDLKESNREQADHIAVKLRIAGLWFRKRVPGSPASPDATRLKDFVERLAMAEHDRWVAEKRRKGWIVAPCQEKSCRNNEFLLHNCLFRWEELTDEHKQLDINTVKMIPDHLAKADYEIVIL